MLSVTQRHAQAVINKFVNILKNDSVYTVNDFEIVGGNNGKFLIIMILLEIVINRFYNRFFACRTSMRFGIIRVAFLRRSGQKIPRCTKVARAIVR